MREDQLTACAALGSGAPCTTDEVDGRCFDGVCLAPGCGNLVVEPGEQCDDGNRISGDGCSADCTSTESCANGVTDLAFGEACDDGNLRSHDGCDSKCQIETTAWTTIGVAPIAGLTGHGAYDERRHVLVHFADGLTWEWDGAAWKLAATTGPPAPTWSQLVYDSDRGLIVLVGSSAPGVDVRPVNLVWEWDGTQWHERTGLTPPSIAEGVAAYDRVSQRVVIVAPGNNGTLTEAWSPATGAWSGFAFPASIVSDLSIAFDVARGKTVLVLGGDTPTTWELAATTWTQIASGLPEGQVGAPALAYDRSRGKLVGVGGIVDEGDTITFSNRMLELTGATWSVTSAKLATPRADVELVADTQALALIAFGGRDLRPAHDDLQTLLPTDVTHWAPIAQDYPHLLQHAVAAYDVGHDVLVLVQGDPDVAGETWLWDGSWHRATGAGPQVASDTAMTYDPVRGASVLVDRAHKQTWTFDGTSWSVLGDFSADLRELDLAYDSAQQRIAALGNDGLQFLPSHATTWAPGPESPFGADFTDTATLAFDARNQQLVAISDLGNAFDLVGDHWDPTLSPGDGYQLIADSRRGSVEFVAANGVAWERAGAGFTQSVGEPVGASGPGAYDPANGRLFVIGATTGSRVLLVRTTASALPDETCAAGVDADGDGEAGCADDDCWWSCAPACPPFTSCP